MPCRQRTVIFRFSSMCERAWGCSAVAQGALRTDRKELCLQKPVVMLAALFYDCWGVLQDSAGDANYARTAAFFLPVLAFGYAALSLLLFRCNSCWGRKILRPEWGGSSRFRSRYGVSGC